MAKTVLVVDDIPFVRKVLSELLNELGYSVVGEAANGAEAIEKFGQLSPDLVTMDIVMPKMSGIEAARAILKLDKGAVVVMITGLDQEHFMMEAIQAGAKDIIIKPFQSSEVERILERALKKDSSSLVAPAVSRSGS